MALATIAGCVPAHAIRNQRARAAAALCNVLVVWRDPGDGIFVFQRNATLPTSVPWRRYLNTADD